MNLSIANFRNVKKNKSAAERTPNACLFVFQVEELALLNKSHIKARVMWLGIVIDIFPMNMCTEVNICWWQSRCRSRRSRQKVIQLPDFSYFWKTDELKMSNWAANSIKYDTDVPTWLVLYWWHRFHEIGSSSQRV